ncbi:sulfotransferase family protein [Sphaerisporangium sp. B11E5]|uniref:sulfotransferase family protein n=1 Tax=Sphaerisporangium sp. B11E5 TaxID=3153563 RepID=UPI00325CD720
MRVIGAGFGRTGTLSLKGALERLGFAPCYHMVEVLTHPADIYRWLDIAEGRSRDFDAVLGGYEATVDWPAASYWRELAAYYPGAKMVLTVRDPEQWYESMVATILKRVDPPRTPVRRLATAVSRWRRSDLDAFNRMADRAVTGRSFHGSMHGRDRLIRAFNDHIDEVREAIPAERLLVYEVSEGWEPLCRFLGVPVPQEPFPRLNDRENFGQISQAFWRRAVWHRSERMAG